MIISIIIIPFLLHHLIGIQAQSSGEKKLRTLTEVGESKSKNLNLSKNVNSLIDEHRVKKEDFKVAVNNFKKLLEDSKISVSQIEKLERQYQMIIHDYRENRRVLETELPKIIKTLVSKRFAFQELERILKLKLFIFLRFIFLYPDGWTRFDMLLKR